MIQRAVSSAVRALSRPGPLVGIALVAGVLSGLTRAMGRPHGLSLQLLILSLGGLRSYAFLGVQAVSLGLVRGETDAASRGVVSPRKFLQIMFVGLGVGAVIFAAALVVAGFMTVSPLAGSVTALVLLGCAICVGVMFSQYALLILDDDDLDALEAIALSSDLTKGHRAELLGLLLASLATMVPLGFVLGSIFHSAAGRFVVSTLLTGVSTCFTCLNAAVYLELVRDQDKRLEHVAADLVAP